MQISAENLISYKLPFEDVSNAFNNLIGMSSTLGLILHYQEQKDLTKKVYIKNDFKKDLVLKASDLNVSFIGAGNYSKRKINTNFQEKWS